MSWKCQVMADDSGEWCNNELVFATSVEAATYGLDLQLRWTAVREWRAVESDEPVNYRMVGAKLVPVNDPESKWKKEPA